MSRSEWTDLLNVSERSSRIMTEKDSLVLATYRSWKRTVPDLRSFSFSLIV